jgi:hypothetical protein
MDELKPCPFCGAKLMHIRGKRVNRYYNGEPTLYEHPQKQSCILGRFAKETRVYETDIEAWNRRAGDGK